MYLISQIVYDHNIDTEPLWSLCFTKTNTDLIEDGVCGLFYTVLVTFLPHPSQVVGKATFTCSWSVAVVLLKW